MSCQQLIKRFCKSNLQHEVHVPFIRSKLYVNSATVFQTLHENSLKEPLSTIARKYSIIIREQIQHVEQFYGPKAIEERAIYQQLERLWNLCQILYFPDQKDKGTVTQLMNWYNKSYKPYLLEYDQQTIFFSKSTFQHKDFWSYAARLAVFGQLSQLSKLFSHVLLDVEFQLFWDLLSFMKELHNLTSQSIEWLRTQHSHIRQVITKLSASQNSHHAKKMKDIFALLMGDESTTLRYAKNDIHAFISCTYYKDNVDTIHGVATGFFNKYNSNSEDDNENQLMRHFLCGDIYEGLELCANYDWWFIVHFADLLSVKKVLDQSLYYTVEDGSTLSMSAREYFILTYASYLNNQFGLWEESFKYLMTCGSLGKEAVIEHLTTMDFQNDDLKLNQVVKFCINYSMKSNGLVLYEKKATICLESKDYKNALQYYSQAEKYQYLDQVFQAVLKDYVFTGQLCDIKAFTNITNFSGIHYIICRDISQINTSYLEGDFQSAANTFKNLIKNDNIPKNLLPVVFGEGWKLIEKKIYFTLYDLSTMKRTWTKAKDRSAPSDFVWYHYFVNPDSKEEDGVSKDILLHDMAEFFDTTAIIIARAIDYQEKRN